MRNAKAWRILRLLTAESGNFRQMAKIYRREITEPGLCVVRLVLEKGIASGEFRRTRAAEAAFPKPREKT